MDVQYFRLQHGQRPKMSTIVPPPPSSQEIRECLIFWMVAVDGVFAPVEWYFCVMYLHVMDWCRSRLIYNSHFACAPFPGFLPIPFRTLWKLLSPTLLMSFNTSDRSRDLTLGPNFVGGLLSWFLYGIIMAQLYIYHCSFTSDRKLISVTVYGLFVLETFHTVIITRVVWALLCEGWGIESALTRISWVDAFIPITAGLVSGWAQAFYAWRIWVLGARSQMWSIIAGSIMLVRFPALKLPTPPLNDAYMLKLMTGSSLAALVAGIRTFSATDISQLEVARGSILAWLVLTVVCDLIITVSMILVLYLQGQQYKGGFRGAAKLRLAQVMRLSIETGTLTMAGAIVMLVFFTTGGGDRLFTMMGFVNSKLYSNSLMASLNSRHPNVSALHENDGHLPPIPVPRFPNGVILDGRLEQPSNNSDFHRTILVTRHKETDMPSLDVAPPTRISSMDIHA
ncbi:hypothetical protein OF83DRAFT_148290 [Amylostereum chailletii]|nr:hypothetical protein OF83DRAFT_148290 [Amylostereum chailletii]